MQLSTLRAAVTALALIGAACGSDAADAEATPIPAEDPQCNADESTDLGLYCCTLQSFCADCSTCSSEEQTIGLAGVEASCKRVVEDFRETGRFCERVSIDETGDVATPRKLAACAADIGPARPAACTEGVNCCTLQRFCDECSTCSSDELKIGLSGVEEACTIVIDEFVDTGRYCHAVSLDEEGELRTDEFLAECSASLSGG